MAMEINRPLKAFRFKAGLFKAFYGKLHRFCRNYKIDALSNHGFSSLVIHRYSSDCAPRKICPLKAINHAHDIVCTACQS
jgi:hypothetical protein